MLNVEHDSSSIRVYECTSSNTLVRKPLGTTMTCNQEIYSRRYNQTRDTLRASHRHTTVWHAASHDWFRLRNTPNSQLSTDLKQIQHLKCLPTVLLTRSTKSATDPTSAGGADFSCASFARGRARASIIASVCCTATLLFYCAPTRPLGTWRTSSRIRPPVNSNICYREIEGLFRAGTFCCGLSLQR